MLIKQVVVNASPLITLFKGQLVDLLPQLVEQVQVPPAVWQEVTLSKNDLIDSYERRHNPQEPIVNLESCVELFVQSLQLDVSELMEPEEEVQYPAQRRSRLREEEMGSVVGILDQAALLAQLDQRLSEEPGMTEAEAFNRAIATAHDEDVSAWAGAIVQGIKELGGEAVLLLELQRAIGMPLIQIWLALLLSGYDVEQRGGFYETETIWVAKP
jgi:hypothetical protein